LSDSSGFAEGWASLFRAKKKPGRACLVAAEGTGLVVDFTAAWNYLSDRHLLIMCDVTERATTESLLKKSKEWFQHMANNIQEIFWMTDAETQELSYANRAYATTTGHSIEKSQNKSVFKP
jgi:PAS domain-containing protein